jgi:hypothetical protein
VVVVSGEDTNLGWAPPWQPQAALQQLQRAFRDLKLTARGTEETSRFELRGRCVVELALRDGQLSARLARKLTLTPEFDRYPINQAAEQRKLLDETKRRLDRWEAEE